MICDGLGEVEEVAGRTIKSVSVDTTDEGEALVLEFEGGGALAISGTELWAHVLTPMSETIRALIDANPADGPTFVEMLSDGALTVERFGGTYSMTKHELPWWMPAWLSTTLFALRHPVNGFRMWRDGR